jgi:hypothetical protein
MLLEHDFQVAGAKDDGRDARVLGGALRTDREAFRLVIDDPVMIELREWWRMADELQQERTRLANRIRHQLWRHYPEAIELTDDIADDWFLAVWQQVPTPATAARRPRRRSRASSRTIASAASMPRLCCRPCE